MDVTEVRRMIEEACPGSRVEVVDQGGGDHLAVTVVAEVFRGKSRIQRHQMIYKLFQQEMATEEIHALALKTLTPEEGQDPG